MPPCTHCVGEGDVGVEQQHRCCYHSAAPHPHPHLQPYQCQNSHYHIWGTNARRYTCAHNLRKLSGQSDPSPGCSSAASMLRTASASAINSVSLPGRPGGSSSSSSGLTACWRDLKAGCGGLLHVVVAGCHVAAPYSTCMPHSAAARCAATHLSCPMHTGVQQGPLRHTELALCTARRRFCRVTGGHHALPLCQTCSRAASATANTDIHTMWSAQCSSEVRSAAGFSPSKQGDIQERHVAILHCHTLTGVGPGLRQGSNCCCNPPCNSPKAFCSDVVVYLCFEARPAPGRVVKRSYAKGLSGWKVCVHPLCQHHPVCPSIPLWNK